MEQTLEQSIDAFGGPIFSQEEDFPGDDVRTLFVDNIWQGLQEEDFLSSKRYQKFCDRRISEAIEYYMIGAPEEIEESFNSINGNRSKLFAICLLNLRCAAGVGKRNIIVTPISVEYPQQKINALWNYLMSFKDDAEVVQIFHTEFAARVNRLLKTFCLSRFRDEEITSSNAIRKGGFQSGIEIGLFLDLCNNALIETIEDGKAKEKKWDNFGPLRSVPKMAKIYSESKKELLSARETIAEQERKISDLKKKNERLRERLQDAGKTKREGNPLTVECRKYEKQLEKAQRRTKNLESEIENLKNALEVMRKLEQDETIQFDYEGKYLFVGGHYSTINKFRTIMPNAKFVEKANDPLTVEEIRTCAAVIYLTTFVSHSTVSYVQSFCGDIPQIYTSKTGAEAVISDIAPKLIACQGGA